MQKGLEYLSSNRVMITYELPFNEVVLDFYDRLKTLSRGYASLDYHVTGYWTSPSGQARSDGERRAGRRAVDHRAQGNGVHARGRALAVKLRKLIPASAVRGGDSGNDRWADHRARVGGKALRKNVLAKCYGGDISRKRKLLEKQKEGKRRMKRVGRVEIPQEAFLAVLRVDAE